MHMLHSDAFTLKTEDDIHLFINCWPGSLQGNKPQKSEDAKILLIVHGLGEHGERYRHLPNFLNSEFERFYVMDLRGHGRSGGLRGFAPSFNHLSDDVKMVVEEIQKREPGKKLYLFAHSFGGLVCLNYLFREDKTPFTGAIISAPLLGVALKVPAYKRALADVLLMTLPKLQLANEVNPGHLSHDPSIVEAYVKDRLVHNKMTPQLFKEFTAAIEWVMHQPKPLLVPVLFLIPGQDFIVDSKKAVRFFQNLKSRDKHLREYPEMYHEVVNEIGKEKIFEDIKQWLHRKS